MATFYINANFTGKLMPKKVTCGVILMETTFTIKDRQNYKAKKIC